MLWSSEKNPKRKSKMVVREGMNIGLIIVNLVFFAGICSLCCAQNISRRSFPEGFVFGTASSAYQYEGSVKEDERGQTIWDTFAHTFGKIQDFSNADVANDHYHLYDGDVQLMKDMGLDSYRLSIAWSRIYPHGTDEINRAGIDHYNSVINALLSQGIEPYVTLYHWDLPQSLQDRYRGWLSPQSIKDFATYAETCFKEFGDRVKHWITFNEPNSFAVQGYYSGRHAPGRCSVYFGVFCKGGNSTTEPYIVGHNVLLAHATAVDIYRKKYHPTQSGSVGISLHSFWYEPASNSAADVDATQRTIDFHLGWFMEPLIVGDYPSSMRSRAGSRLPMFSPAQANQLKGSFDFIGLNHYTTWYASHNKIKIIDDLLIGNTLPDSGAIALPVAIGKPVHERANSIWLSIVPHGIRSLMNYVREKYGNPLVMITENGMDDGNSPFTSIKHALKDEKRIKYHNDYLTNLLAAIKEDGCDVRGYFVWSLLDNWEWAAGFSSRFGLYYVDYKDKQKKRYAKDSVKWFKDFLAS